MRAALRRTTLAGAGLFALTLAAPAAAGSGPAISVDVTADRHPIAPTIYGVNAIDVTDDADWAFLVEIKAPVVRFGGDATTRYNWKVDATNSGFDWYFMAGSGQSPVVPNKSVDDLAARTASASGALLVTIPMIDYVNKATSMDCSYPKKLFPNQDSFNPYVHPNGDDCGNGQSGGKNIPLSSADILRIHEPNSTAFATEWVQHLLAKYGPAAKGTVRYYDLDNEPGGWSNTHRDIVPNQPGYTGSGGITERGLAYAAAVKAVDPTAQILGPVDFGYAVYGNAPGYLDAFAAAEKSGGKRLLDYLDEHYYPASNVGDLANTTDPGSAELQAQRLRSTRSLWDPTYKDESWIGQYNPPIRLIPYFKEMIAQHYPGTKLAITEYNWGATNDINGALAEADVLGIFGREGVDLATMWGPPKATYPAAYAFRMYRSYDGHGASFGDTSVRATSADPGTLAAYAAVRSSDGALTILLVNKTAAAIDDTVAVSGFASTGKAQVWQYAVDHPGGILSKNDLAVSGGAVPISVAPSSITLLVLPSSAPPPPPPASDGGVGVDASVGGEDASAGGAPPGSSDPGAAPGTSDTSAGASSSSGCAASRAAVGEGATAPLALAILALVRRRRRAATIR